MSEDELNKIVVKQEKKKTKITETPCPKCGNLQSFFIKRGMGWARCPECDTGMRENELPENAQHLIREVFYKKQKGDDDNDLDGEDREDNETPFNRPTEPWKVLKQILREYGVKKTAMVMMINRCKRKPLTPPEVQDLLTRLKSGLGKGEITYVAEEYYYALKQEDEKRITPGRKIFGEFEGEEEEEYPDAPQYTPQREGPVRRQYPWVAERNIRKNKGQITVEDLNKILDERDRLQREREEKNEMLGLIQNQQQQIAEMRALLQNPPKAENSEDKMLTMLLQQQQNAHQETMKLMERMQELERASNDKMFKMLEKQANDKPVVTVSGDFDNDGARVLAEAIQSGTSIVKQNKPIQSITQAVAASKQPVQPMESNPVKKKKKGDLGILSELPEELTTVDD